MFDLQQESCETALSTCVPWSELSGKTVLITGVTGLVGSACARVLLERNRVECADIMVVGLARNAQKVVEVLAGYQEADGLHVIEKGLTDLCVADCRPDYIIHAACPTASRFFSCNPVETADAIVLGTRHLLEFAHRVGVQGFVYVSSMEVYGDGNSSAGLTHLLKESDVGYVCPTVVRSCYPEGKRMAEQYCTAFFAEYQVPVNVVRLAQTFGPGIPHDDSRLFAMCARNAMEGKDIVLKTTGASTRMYLYTMDAVTALLVVMTKGTRGAVYNAANPSTYSSVVEMAQRVASLVPRGAAVRCELDPSAPYPPEHHLPLDVSPLLRLGWVPMVDLMDMYRNLIAYLEA